jgi:hypothetical protein
MRKLIVAGTLGISALAALPFAVQAAAPAYAVAQDTPPSPQATPAPGAKPGGMAARMMMRSDADKDGNITRAEDQARAAQRFAKLDTNNDGQIDAAERKAAADASGRGGMMIGRMLDRLDANGDGVISRVEYDAQTKARFDRLDANGDGVIDATERAAARSSMGGRRGAPDAGPSTIPPAPSSPSGA